VIRAENGLVATRILDLRPDAIRAQAAVTGVPGYGNPVGRLPNGSDDEQVRALFKEPLDPFIQLGKKLNGDGNGQQKDVYALGDRWVLRVMKDLPTGEHLRGEPPWKRAWILVQDYKTLGALRAEGVRVPAFLTTGTFRGKPADIVERFDFMTKEKGWKEKLSRLRGTGIERDIVAIERFLERGKVIVDLQLGAKRGAVMPLDVFSIASPKEEAGWAKYGLAHVRELKAAAGL
jgi:hypothetical protein